MTIKTLEYIHNLLVSDENARKEDYEHSRNLQHVYEASEECDEELVRSQTLYADSLMHVYINALSALNDFESVEW